MSRTKDKIKLEHYAMPTVGGDPIVESGSNSDGEWAKWADGSLTCHAPGFLVPIFSSSELRATWVYPVPPTSQPSVSATSDSYASDSEFSYLEPYHLSNSANAANVDIRVVLANAVAVSGDGMRFSMFLSGYWK